MSQNIALAAAIALAPLAAYAQATPIGPGSGSIADNSGNAWNISPSGSIQENGQWVAGGGGTSALMIVGGVTYGQDARTKEWFTFGAANQAWTPSSPPQGALAAGLGGSSATTTADTAAASQVSALISAAGCGSGSGTKPFGVLPLAAGGAGQIIGPDGKVFVPRGVNVMEGMEPSVDALRGNFPGINFVRYANYQFAPPEKLAPWINSLTQAGIVVEIEDHTTSAGGNAGGAQGSVFTGQQLQNESNWYASLAAYFKSNPYVWFGTNNEPPEAGGSLSQWHLATYQAIRGAGSQTIIMIDPWGAYLTDGLDPSAYSQMSNVVWDVHFYGWVANYSTDQGTVNSKLASIVSGVQALKSAGGVTMPVIIGEYGNSTTGYDIDANGTQVVDAVQQAVMNGQIAGSSAWAYAPGNPGDGLVQGGSLSSYGQQVASYIQRSLSGTNVCSSNAKQVAQGGQAGSTTLVVGQADTSASLGTGGTDAGTSPQNPAAQASAAADQEAQSVDTQIKAIQAQIDALRAGQAAGAGQTPSLQAVGSSAPNPTAVH